MEGLTSQSWFWWAVVLVLGLPALLVVLGELHSALLRRGNGLARPVGLLRNYALPTAALLLLLSLVPQLSAESTIVKIVATVFGFLLIVFLLSTLSAALFLNAGNGTWRRRLPAIFIDLIRLLLIVIGVAALLALVWGADVGGMFAALGVTGIVVGLAVQNAAGGIISGLLLLFEQPFTLGDWLETEDVKGRVVEVNWRAVHLDTGRGLQIVPNASLADASFTNLSRPTPEHTETVSTSFAVDDDPSKVCDTLDEVARDLPQGRPGAHPRTRPCGAGTYETDLPVATYAEAEAARTAFLTRVWYSTRREGLHLDGADIQPTQEQVEAALRTVAPILNVSGEGLPALAGRLQLARYGHGEKIQREGVIPDQLSIVIDGRAMLSVDTPDGPVIIAAVEPGDYLGQTVLTREPAPLTGMATGPVATLQFPRPVIEELILANPRLGREIGRVIDERRRAANVARGGRLAKLLVAPDRPPNGHPAPAGGVDHR